MADSYLTIRSEARGLYKDRGSKFFSYAFPVSSEASIKDILDNLRREYHDARHHCYAWRLNSQSINERASDDGEPSSSAGKPILNQIEKRELNNVLVVVIRYFGGTLLGVGGLINAYRTAASEALDNSEIITRYIYIPISVHFSYNVMNAVMKIIKEHDLEQYDQAFEVDCSLKINVRKGKAERILEQFKLIDGCNAMAEQ